MAPKLVENLLDRIHEAKVLDGVAEPVASVVTRVVGKPPIKDLLSGTWLGHPLHPMLTDVVIGAWTGAFFLDFLGSGAEDAADALVGIGVLSAVPTAAAGLSDWSDLFGAERRVGLVHAGANVVALGCYGLSWLARRRGDRRRGVVLGVVGATVASVGGFLGGHLTYRQGVNVDRNAWAEPTGDWVDVLGADELGEDTPVVGRAGEVPVVLVKRGGTVHVLADVCGHAGGPLHEGSVDDGCITCPWHGSTFRLTDGFPVHGPATAPQPAFEARITDGTVQVRSKS